MSEQETATGGEEELETVWWAFRPRDDAGVFIPVEPWALRSVSELPTDEEVRRVGSPCVQVVEMFGGDPGEVEGFLTDEADFYVALPLEVLRDHLAFSDAMTIEEDPTEQTL
jgi:hypothetical protein